jgi:hypothetical protein
MFSKVTSACGARAICGTLKTRMLQLPTDLTVLVHCRVVLNNFETGNSLSKRSLMTERCSAENYLVLLSSSVMKEVI